MADTKRCAKCGRVFPISFFRRMGHMHMPRAICRGCEQTARDQRKQVSDGRWQVKIRDTIRRHAARLGIPVARLERDFGWVSSRMLHEAQHAYGNGCGYCGATFKSMGHGLSDLTLDVVNPDDPPYYTTNVRWCCMTCNREKSRTPRDEWGARCAAWEAWKSQPVTVVAQPFLPFH